MPANTNTGDKYKWLVFLTVSVGGFMVTLDSSIISIILPRLTVAFDSDASTVLWVPVSYLLTCCSLMLSLGTVGDTIGRKRVYTLGYAFFTLGLVMCSLSQNIVQLLIFRVVEGFGAAMIMALGVAIIVSSIPAAERGKFLGMFASVFSVGLFIGPALGGFLLDVFDWRATFYLRIPVGIIGLAMSWFILKDDRKENAVFKLDLWGMVTLFGCLCSLLLFFNLGGRNGFSSPLVLALAVLAVVCFILLLFIESRAAFPIIDLSLFRNRRFASGNATMSVIFIAQSCVNFLLPFYLIQGRGYSASVSGLIASIPFLMMLLVGPFAGWLSDRIGSRPLCILGAVLTAAGLFLLSIVDTGSGYWGISWILVLYGVGNGIFYSPTSSLIMGSVSKERLGIASAMLATMRQVGLSVGMAIAGMLFAARQSHYIETLSGEIADRDLLGQTALINGIQDALFIAGIICLIAVLISLIKAEKPA